MIVFTFYVYANLILLVSTQIALATKAGSESTTFFFDSTAHVVAAKLGDTCYVTKISPELAATLHQPAALKDFEFHMLQLIILHQRLHTMLTLRELVDMSGMIAHGCLSAAETYRISDPANIVSTTPAFRPRDCHDLQKHGANTSGKYRVYPTGVMQGAEVYCDMETDGGGWLVFQKRLDGTVDFNQNWNFYTSGFGNVSHEFWLGNSLLRSIVSRTEYRLRIDMEGPTGVKKFAVYDRFLIEDEAAKFRLDVSGYYGDAGDQLSHQNNMEFSTRDSDNDIDPTLNCAATYHSGWWYSHCLLCDLNGQYTPVNGFGVYWNGFSDSIKRADMKIRPLFLN